MQYLGKYFRSLFDRDDDTDASPDDVDRSTPPTTICLIMVTHVVRTHLLASVPPDGLRQTHSIGLYRLLP